MSGAEFKALRKSWGLSDSGIASIMRLNARTIRRWEDGTTPIDGPAIVLLELMRDSKDARDWFWLPLHNAGIAA